MIFLKRVLDPESLVAGKEGTTSGQRSSPVKYSIMRCVSNDSCMSPEMSSPEAKAT